VLGRFFPIAILAGITAGSILSIVSGALVGFLMVSVFGELETDAAENSVFLVAALLCAGIGYLVAGLVAARLSPGEEILNAGATGALLLVSAFSFPGLAILPFPVWFNVAFLGMAVPFALLGGRLYLGRAPAA